jgi:hypothetical protein
MIAGTGSAALKAAALHSNLRHLPTLRSDGAKVRWRTKKNCNRKEFFLLLTFTKHFFFFFALEQLGVRGAFVTIHH